MIDGIAAQHRVIAFDNRGVGRRTGPAHHRGDGRRGRVHPAGLEKVDLLGFSLGGGSPRWSRQAPDLVRRMILAGTGPGARIDEILKIAAAPLKAAHLEGPRTPVLPRRGGGRDGLLRPAEGATEGRDKRISLQARLAQLKAIRRQRPDDLSLITQPVSSPTATTT